MFWISSHCMSSPFHVPSVQQQSDAIRESDSLTIDSAFDWLGTLAMIRSISVPMALMLAESVSRLFVGGRFQASGKVSLTAPQKMLIALYIPIVSISPSPIPLNCASTPRGELMLRRNTSINAVSTITAESLLPSEEAWRIL